MQQLRTTHLVPLSFGLFVLLQLHWSAAQRFSLADVNSSIGDIARGINNATKLLRPEYIDQLSTNLDRALPAAVAINLGNELCTTAVSGVTIQPAIEYQPRIENIKLQLRTACEKRSYALSNLRDLEQDLNFDVRKKVVIFSPGWTTNINDARQDVIAKAYNCRTDTNYFALDVGEYINTLYTWASVNTDTIGQLLAYILQELVQFVPMENVHLIGHSLGAQIMGSAARYFRTLTGRQLPYVTGLDPALPCFREGETLTTVSASDADFVDIIHTAAGVVGQGPAIGSVDFYVDGKFPIASGCRNSLCSHERVQLYYAESVYPGNEYNFLAKRCTSLQRLQAGRCRGMDQPMGYAVPKSLRGRYVLQVNPKTPFGKNATRNYIPFNSSCGSCNLSGPV